MPLVSRVLDPEPVTTLAAYVAAGGGDGLTAARELGPEATIELLEAAGLRGRGGAGFPTGTKWRTVAGFESATVPATVVVNGAEGEPGCFKDRELMRPQPVPHPRGRADRRHHGRRRRGHRGRQGDVHRRRSRRLRTAIAEITDAGWTDGVAIDIVAGPNEYLYGEETGLLEVVDGRPPFPRIAPPYRHGAEEVGEGRISAGSTWRWPARPARRRRSPTTSRRWPTWPLILANGADWFREYGTAESPGTIVVHDHRLDAARPASARCRWARRCAR